MNIIVDKKTKKRPIFPSGYKKKQIKRKRNAIKYDEKINKIQFYFGKFIVDF
jgi:hypothetical protein